MSQRVGTMGSAVIVVLSVIVAFGHTGSLSQASELGLLVWMPGGHGGVHRGYMPREVVKHC